MSGRWVGSAVGWAGLGSAARLLGKAEVSDLAVAVLVEQQVLGLEIAIEDRTLVQVLEDLWGGVGGGE